MNQDCVDQIWETIPFVMHNMRLQVREVVRHELSIPQFRVLARLSLGPTTASELAEWIGLTLPSLSRMADGFVKKGYVLRCHDIEDRRRVLLRLSSPGLVLFNRAREQAQRKTAALVSSLSEDKRKKLAEGLAILSQTFLNVEENP